MNYPDNIRSVPGSPIYAPIRHNVSPTRDNATIAMIVSILREASQKIAGLTRKLECNGDLAVLAVAPDLEALAQEIERDDVEKIHELARENACELA
ncbi:MULTISPECIES: hypothetical protein [Acetobacter]|uniref:hypothetical protein n=1 Tax=Acetobacter TaxID=434 RepID=UPI000A3C5C21|nr:MULTISPECIES: hypothetical protein [Acetobacter]MBS0959809.1 hypothetical protein [Acetobacter thailandicus]MBS1003198.1 hypothetical protein [Acetobacter thailandicus]OUJ10318.1 hypothetical protein HK25_07040 [Acetobacter sp. DsW_059]